MSPLREEMENLLEGREVVTADRYTRKTHKKFVKDMLKAGLKPFHYEGSYYYRGPAVEVDYPEDAESETRVKTRVDRMGKGYVVYPTN